MSSKRRDWSKGKLVRGGGGGGLHDGGHHLVVVAGEQSHLMMETKEMTNKIQFFTHSFIEFLSPWSQLRAVCSWRGGQFWFWATFGTFSRAGPHLCVVYLLRVWSSWHQKDVLLPWRPDADKVSLFWCWSLLLAPPNISLHPSDVFGLSLLWENCKNISQFQSTYFPHVSKSWTIFVWFQHRHSYICLNIFDVSQEVHSLFKYVEPLLFYV